MSRLPSMRPVKPRYVAIMAVLLGLCCAPAAFALSGGADDSGIPDGVAKCLALPDGDRGACFAGESRDVPQFVTDCLALPDSDRAACFAGQSPDVPQLVKDCLSRPDSDRAACFAQGAPDLPDFVRTCLQMPEALRDACFSASAPSAGDSRDDRGDDEPGRDDQGDSGDHDRGNSGDHDRGDSSGDNGAPGWVQRCLGMSSQADRDACFNRGP